MSSRTDVAYPLAASSREGNVIQEMLLTQTYQKCRLMCRYMRNENSGRPRANWVRPGEESNCRGGGGGGVAGEGEGAEGWSGGKEGQGVGLREKEGGSREWGE